jgi:outer membrane protein OmpA-like peptidoglycan-associated protein
MKTFRILSVLVALVAFSSMDAGAQGFLDRLGRRVGRAAEEAVTRKAEQAVERGVDKATDPDTYKGDGNNQQPAPETAAPADTPASGQQAPAAQAPQAQSLEMTYAKSDFVPGDEIIFDDQLVGEQLGEFPSMWDLIGGNAEISKIDGENVIYFDESTTLAPLMKNPKNYLAESYTIEFDFYVSEEVTGWWRIELMGEDNFRKSNIELWSEPNANRVIEGSWVTTTGEDRNSGSKADLSREGWHHLAISFNRRALKVYFDGLRTMNVPNVAQANWCRIFATTKHYIKNIRIAKGAVPLYDRMMSEGKFITYGITFDVGKSTIKPESMGEINRIVQLMNENPTLKFSVEGHTDSTGNAASNQTLSEQRSAAIVAKLTELGIAADRLTASGKGQNSPIADNTTDEGRAKNRRVEFVKI